VNVMSINYSCFISYPHSAQSEVLGGLVKQLKKALENIIGLSIREEVYLDEERLKPGYSLKKSFAEVICKSACMIVVFTRLYQESDYCLREFLVMENIERKRNEILGSSQDGEHRMIIPIIIRKVPPNKSIPKKFEDIYYWDLSGYSLLGFNLEAIEESKTKIDQIADLVVEHYSRLKQAEEDGLDNIDCSSYDFPTIMEAKAAWKGDILEPQPLPFH